MKQFDFLNNYADAVCVFSQNNELVFRNNIFKITFSSFKNVERFKKRFNFNWCILSSDYINLTPIDVVLNSKENFHTIASYQNADGQNLYFYVYSYFQDGFKIIVLKDITSDNALSTLNKAYLDLKDKYEEINDATNKFSKLQEHAQTQVLKMGIINRISLVIRETNDIETILTSALSEINDLLGSFKTYFSVKEKMGFKIKYTHKENNDKNLYCEYENEVIETISKKEIIASPCRKECINADSFFNYGVTRIIIPIYNKNELLGIIVTFTKQRVSVEENREILQSIAVQLASSIIQAGLIQQLNKKNKKLEKTLTVLKETQLQLINTEKMASVGQLVSGVAHEINTPLASINSNSSMISRLLKDKELLSKEQIDIVSELNSIDIEAVQRISNIVKSLKRFVRLDEAQFQEADINSELDLTLKLMAHEIKSNIQVEKNYGDIPLVLCSVNMLNQVFMNLLVNACHSIVEKGLGGIIKISTCIEQSNLIVKISDNGVGMDIDTQNKIFNVGFTTKKKGIGTGLGLSISKKIIELHKGSISFVSEKNLGTEFIVSIPLNVKN